MAKRIRKWNKPVQAETYIPNAACKFQKCLSEYAMVVANGVGQLEP